MGFFGMSTHDLHPGSITDIEGLTVGHAAVRGRATGCSVVLCPEGAVCGAAVRGGAPGTRETDLLRPENTVQVVHAVLLTGGSAFGLDAAGGVMRWLDERGHGLPVGAAVHTAAIPAPGPEVLRLPSRLPIRVPIVPAAVLFDLWIGDARIRPDAGTGYAACEAASSGMPAQGSAGAGLGATVGKLFGIARAMRGGIGTASVQLGGFTVGALVAVNAIGDVLDASGRVIAGARSEDGRELVRSTQALLAGHGPDHRHPVTYCFDDLGVEQNARLYGNECNVLAEILLDRYDRFVTHQMRTHLTSNLNAPELETLYGDRLRSRLHEMCNVLSFPATAPDRRR